MRKLLSSALVSAVLVSSLYGVATASTAQVKTNDGTLTQAFFTDSLVGGKPGRHITTLHASKPSWLVMTWTNIAPPASFQLGLYYQGIGAESPSQDLSQSGTYVAPLQKALQSVPHGWYGPGWSLKLILNAQVQKTLNFSIAK